MSAYRSPRAQLCMAYLVIILTACCHLAESFLNTSPGVVEPSHVQISEGTNLTLDCVLTSYTETSLNSSSLYFTSSYMNNPPIVVNPLYYHVINSTALRLFYPNIQREEGGTFTCYMDDSTAEYGDTNIGQATVDIYEFPPEVVITFYSFNFDNMTVEYFPSTVPRDPINYIFSYQILELNISGGCLRQNDLQFPYSCIFCGSSASGVCLNQSSTFWKYFTYFINITTHNIYGSTTSTKQIYVSPKIVKPGPVTQLKAATVGSDSVGLSWEYPTDLHIGLVFEVNAVSHWGENISVNVGNETSWVLTNLIAYTDYRIAVRCKPVEEGYWSADSTVLSKTSEAAPSVAPAVPVGFFRILGCSESTRTCQLAIFWQLIETRLQNGVILGYRLTVGSTTLADVKGSNVTSAIISLSYDVDNWIQLVAYTSVGSSPPRTLFFPTNFNDFPNVNSQGLYAEYTEDGGSVVIAWEHDDSVENYTLMYCSGTSNNKTHCQDAPVDMFLDGNLTNITMPAVPYRVHSLSSNYINGTNGLTPDWICVYDYSGKPAAPQINSIKSLSDTSLRISWDVPVCDSKNRVRIYGYSLIYYTKEASPSINITLPGDAKEYEMTDLKPETEYTLELRGVSRSDVGPPDTEVVKTNVDKPVSVVVPVVVSVISAVVLVVAIILIVYCIRKCCKWSHEIKPSVPTFRNTDLYSEICNVSAQDSGATGSSNVSDDDPVPYSVTNQTFEPDSSDEPPPFTIQIISDNQNNQSSESRETATSNGTTTESEQSIQTYTAVVPSDHSSEPPPCNSSCDQTCSGSEEPSGRLDSTMDSSGAEDYSRGNLLDKDYAMSNDLEEPDSDSFVVHDKSSTSAGSSDPYSSGRLENVRFSMV